MGANSSSAGRHGNPVLRTSNDIIIQPYWLIIINVIVLQILQRLYNRFTPFRKKYHKTWYLSLEIAVLGKRIVPEPIYKDVRHKDEEDKRWGKLNVDQKLKEIRPEYSLLDFIFSVVAMAHFIYACNIQRACLNHVNYSAWACYNAFGYRLYNYVLPSVISVLVQSIIQAVHTHHTEDPTSEDHKDDCYSLAKYLLRKLLLYGTIALSAGLCLIFIPYLITNALVMIVGFCWLLGPLLIILILLYATFITSIASIASSCKMCCDSDGYCRLFFFTHCAVGLQVFGCLILSMAYNYSQYWYFGDSYLSAIGYEFQSRDTVAWGRALTNNTQLVTDNILALL